jgi:hypothetical protein
VTEQPPPGFAQGADDLMTVLTEARAAGATELTIVDAGGEPALRCGSCREVSPPADFGRVWTRRLEGASDPADEMFVAGLECPRCRATGVLAVPFGPTAEPQHVTVIRALPPEPED